MFKFLSRGSASATPASPEDLAILAREGYRLDGEGRVVCATCGSCCGQCGDDRSAESLTAYMRARTARVSA